MYCSSQAVLFVGFCVASFSLAALLSLLLEAPVVSLLTLVRPRRGPRAPAGPHGKQSKLQQRQAQAHTPVPHMPESWKTAGFGY